VCKFPLSLLTLPVYGGHPEFVTTIYGKGKEGKRKFTYKRQQAVLFSSDLKDEPARGSKYCQNKRYQIVLVNFGQPVYKVTKTSKFLMEV